MTDPLDGCTDAQIQAITHPGGPLLVLAGAGSGKTRVITRRIAWLINQGVRPYDILAITFTNKAADEMRERVVALCGERSIEQGLWVSTFHSMCARMLRHHAERLGYTSNYSIYDTGDTMTLVRRLMKELEISKEETQPGAVRETISNLKNEMILPEFYAEQASNPFEANVRQVYGLYQEALKEANAMDFDDLLLNVVQLFRAAPDIQERYGQRFRHILVDEYQDTNHAQYRIAAALAERHRNICVTGDPDQSIYGWRGADIKNILDFESQYSDATTVVLDKNYRSTKTILDAANHVIARNAERKHKDLHTDNPQGGPVRVVAQEDEVAEARFLASDIRARCSGSGGSYDDVAIFYRTNAQSRAIETALRDAGLPHRIVQGVSFFDRREVKDVISYLRVCVNPSDSESLARIMNTPSRGIGAKSEERLRAYARRNGVSLLAAMQNAREAGLSQRQVRGCEGVISTISAVRAMEDTTLVEQIEMLLSRTQYRQYAKETFEDGADRVTNVDEILNLAGQYMAAEGEDAALQGFLEQAALSSDQDALDLAQGAVKLMTLHTAKGLEFPHVYITGLEEKLLPLDGDDRHIEEERRLFFVGVTRAKRHLTLTRANLRRKYGRPEYMAPSRFLDEIPGEDTEEEGLPLPMDKLRGPERSFEQPVAARVEEVLARDTNGTPLREGDRVRHPTFGGGTLTNISGSGDRQKATVRFATVGEKSLMLKFARLEKALR